MGRLRGAARPAQEAGDDTSLLGRGIGSKVPATDYLTKNATGRAGFLRLQLGLVAYSGLPHWPLWFGSLRKMHDERTLTAPLRRLRASRRDKLNTRGISADASPFRV